VLPVARLDPARPIPHNTLVLGNLPPVGGFQTFRRLRREESTIATWLQDAGYRTAFYGKYLNGYTEADAPPPGWDEWHAANNDGYFNVNYKLNENREVVSYGGASEDYLTDVIARKAADHIRRFSNEGRPFFLYLATFAPHSPYNAAPRHKGMFKDAELPRPRSFNEADVSDKPGFIRDLPRLSEDDIAEITTHHRQRLECLQAVDELVQTAVETLEETGELDRTYIVYASDNGFHLGQHRMKEGKDTAYEEDIRTPLAIRGPGITEGQNVGGMVLNIDLAPTFAAWAGIEVPDFVDGRSLVPLLDDPEIPWRRSFLIQRLGLEADERLKPGNALAIRTERYTYVAYNTGEQTRSARETPPRVRRDGSTRPPSDRLLRRTGRRVKSQTAFSDPAISRLSGRKSWIRTRREIARGSARLRGVPGTRSLSARWHSRTHQCGERFGFACSRRQGGRISAHRRLRGHRR
jgi:N-acetylglucosamine-6-sulfatase